jgi:hypothetical protein
MSDLEMSDLLFPQRSFERLGEAVRLRRMAIGLSHRDARSLSADRQGVGHHERERAVYA